MCFAETVFWVKKKHCQNNLQKTIKKELRSALSSVYTSPAVGVWVKITGFGEVGFRVNVNITTTLLRPTADQISLAKILQGL